MSEEDDRRKKQRVEVEGESTTQVSFAAGFFSGPLLDDDDDDDDEEYDVERDEVDESTLATYLKIANAAGEFPVPTFDAGYTVVEVMGTRKQPDGSREYLGGEELYVPTFVSSNVAQERIPKLVIEYYEKNSTYVSPSPAPND